MPDYQKRTGAEFGMVMLMRVFMSLFSLFLTGFSLWLCFRFFKWVVSWFQ